MAEQQHKFRIAWYDDNQGPLDKTRDSLKTYFSNEFGLDFLTYETYDGFLHYYKNYKTNSDIIFLDIDLGNGELNGLSVYEKIRQTNKKIIIVFVSARLMDPNWRSKIDELQSADPFLATLELPFPSQLQKQKYLEHVANPIKDIINLLKRDDLSLQLNNFIKLDSISKRQLLGNYHQANHDSLISYFKQQKEINWVIAKSSPFEIIETGFKAYELTALKLAEMAIDDDEIYFGYVRNNDMVQYDINIEAFQKLKSFERIDGKILQVSEETVLIKCLIDKDSNRFQERDFDLELFDDVDLSINNIITIKILTYNNERRFLVRQGDLDMQPFFAKKEKRLSGDFSPLFKPLPNIDENNF